MICATRGREHGQVNVEIGRKASRKAALPMAYGLRNGLHVRCARVIMLAHGFASMRRHTGRQAPCLAAFYFSERSDKNG